MSWLIVGFGKQDAGLGCEYELDDEEFDTDEAVEWLGPGARLSTALWPLEAGRLAFAERLAGARLDPESMDLFIVRKPHWYVTATTADEEPSVVDYHLPEEFGFTRAADWIGRWDARMAYEGTPLPEERGTEVESVFGTVPAPGRYRHMLRSTAQEDA